MSYNHKAGQEVSDFISHNIQSGVWKPGDKIWSENEFCNNLNVSRIAVRDAIANLTAISVLRKVRGSGTYVENLDNASLEGTRYFTLKIEDVLELMEFRYVMDPYCTELFAERATKEEIEALEDCYYNMLRHRNNEEKDYYSNQFHHMIALGSKNKFIIKIMEYLNDNMLTHQKLLSKGVRRENYQVGVTYHYKMLQAIKAHDKEMAGIYCRYHIRLGMNLYRTILEKEQQTEEPAKD
ncbi:FCD domain-containing protein [Clostridium sp. AM58-1XD]|uniref:FadR/GntR family transcriptional regulator n=1 Tax=Clostridium sp. AM58-1XD TaxID=2292307 RepID=UPI000E4D4D97|nr:FCD domain-containing protein [Clostridium sp. AM58-1XD]RGZ00388.1 FadR family transcriptional regulator [Clostridium sp. AM58-1XD]